MIIYDVMQDWKTKEYELVKVEVEEKPKTFVVIKAEKSGAYSHLRRIPKDEAWMTPTEAVDVKLALRRNWLENLERRTIDAKQEIESLERLRKQL